MENVGGLKSVLWCALLGLLRSSEAYCCVLQPSFRLSQSQIFLSFGQTFLSEGNSSLHGTLPRLWGHTRWEVLIVAITLDYGQLYALSSCQAVISIFAFFF